MIPPDPGTPRDAESTPDANDPIDPGQATDDGDAPTPDALIPAASPPLTPAVPPVASPPARPGGGTFTIEGRSAPALFVVGWLATLLGAGLVAIFVLSGGRGGSTIVLFIGLALLSIGLVAGAGSQGIERRVRARTAYRGPSPFLVFASTIPVTVLVAVLIGALLSILGVAIDGPLARLLSVTAQAAIYVGLVRLLVVDTGALGWSEMGIRRFDLGALENLGTGALFAVPVIAVTVVVAAILGLLLPVQPVSPLPPAGESVGFAMNLLAGAIVAPIGEELLFRGFATTAWVRDLGPRSGLLRGALFFALVHVLNISGGSVPEVLSLAVVGFAARVPVAIALGWLFLRRGSIWAPIGLHAAFNGILIVLGEIALRGPGGGLG